MPRASRRILIETLPDCTYRVSASLGNGPIQTQEFATDDQLAKFLLHATLGSLGTLLQIEYSMGERSPSEGKRLRARMSS